MTNSDKENQQDRQITALEVAVKLISEKLDNICEDIREIKNKLDNQYVMKVEYEGFKGDILRRTRELETTKNKLGWLIISLVLTAVLSGILANNFLK